jgi:hypothetical protein
VAAGDADPMDEEDLLVRAANAQRLQNAGMWGEQAVADGTELRLTFVYLAAGERPAEGLAAFLEAETDYEIYVRRQGRVGDREWYVAGATQPAPMSLDTLNAWTEWMIAAGAAHGPAAFQGCAFQARRDSDTANKSSGSV